MADSNEKKSERKVRFINNEFFQDKVITNVILILLGVLLIGGILNTVQTRASMKKQQRNNDLALTEVVSILNKNTESAKELTEIYHGANWITLDDIDKLMANGLFERLSRSDASVQEEIMAELADPIDVDFLYILDMDGKVVSGADKSLYGRNPATSNIMTQENLNRILNWCADTDGSIAPVQVKNQFGTFYFYSQPFVYEETQYALTIGVSSATLEDRVSSLTDVSLLLGRMGVINDGFLFAVDKTNGLFRYFKNDDYFLTGQNAFSTGLTRDILTDGYTGSQTMLNDKYFCSSRSLDGDTVIVAAARELDVVSRDKYVLIWSIMGFIIIMTLCSVYAVIVRNDFIRQGTETERIQLSGNPDNPIYFNRTVFNRVLPLMLLGLLAVFGTSFYTQTLLEITEGVDKSQVILQEVTARYEENQESGSIIQDYYDTHLLSSARLISFFMEENPDVLNSESEYYHCTYDSDGNRQYIYDDEGNLLKSVANSSVLQQLCDDNAVDAIYIYDEDGRTIATNTANWFFILSTDADDQSYAFRRILEGHADSFIQPAMTNDLGEMAQYIGVVMNYYTQSDADGSTLYVSRYDYEEARAAGSNSITKHRALLQVELDSQLTETVTGVANARAVLSTAMLDGGAIIMFDNSSDHICLYSPIEASIGRTAADLGISEKAFTGLTYYGINRINGTSYFLYFNYANNYFMATVIPASSMFTTRTTIALITTAVCLAVITVLLLMISISDEKEEEVYELLTSKGGDGNLNSTIFNILLPSGRLASTSKASKRWDNKSIPWDECSPEMKLTVILNWIISIPLLYFVLSAIGINAISSTGSVIHYIMSGNWDRSLNIFAISACIMVIILAVVIDQTQRNLQAKMALQARNENK